MKSLNFLSIIEIKENNSIFLMISETKKMLWERYFGWYFTLDYNAVYMSDNAVFPIANLETNKQ